MLKTALLTLLIFASSTQLRYRAKFDTWACNNKDFMENIYEAIQDGDRETAAAAVTLGIVGGECEEIDEGQVVTVTDLGFIDPLHEIRIWGRFGRYYVIGGHFESVRNR